MTEMEIPNDWRNANITAIHKKGSKIEAGNYRPVSLTSITGKIMETIVRNELVRYFQVNNLFSNRQFGFISGRSTVLQLLKVLEDWTRILDEGGCVDVVYCDFMKAFDKVSHSRLIDKLRFYGIKNPVLGWIEAFLRDRQQRVVTGGTESEWRKVDSGVPQGSVLGPILFVIYINTLPEVASNSQIYLFADDTKIYKAITNTEDCQMLQHDVDKMYEWTNGSLLKFHPDKCGAMRIGSSKLETRTYTMGPEKHVIKNITEEKDIGVIIDDKLSFSKHMAAKIKKANTVMGVIRRTYVHMDEESFLLLYKGLVRPHLEYANQVWAPYLRKDVVAIENVQRRATKLIPGFKDMSYQERLRRLHLPTLRYRRIRGDMIELYKILTDKYDYRVTANIVNVRQDIRRGHKYKLFKKHCRLNIRKFSFAYRTVNTWNDLPNYVVEAKTVKSFERRLDKFWEKEEWKFSMEAEIQTPTIRHANRHPIELTPEAEQA